MLIRDLSGFGPKSQAMLAQAGIHSVARISELGAVKTFVAVKQAGCNASLNLLWAIEGVLSNRSWREVAKNDRLSLLLQLESIEGKAKSQFLPNNRNFEAK